jgi:adenosylcobinamide kinase/adenosylcobinamide-phosphate guanylyltransferase
MEAPVLVADALRGVAVAGNAVLLDCLTLWLANLMEADLDIGSETVRLIAALDAATGPVVIVSNEVGAGIVPDNALARRYSDAHGILNQRVAAAVGRVVLMSAGLPLQLKPSTQRDMTL